MAASVPFPFSAGVMEAKAVSLYGHLYFRIGEVGTGDSAACLDYLELARRRRERWVPQQNSDERLQLAGGGDNVAAHPQNVEQLRLAASWQPKFALQVGDQSVWRCESIAMSVINESFETLGIDSRAEIEESSIRRGDGNTAASDDFTAIESTSGVGVDTF
jgi:hypothetical protein